MQKAGSLESEHLERPLAESKPLTRVDSVQSGLQLTSSVDAKVKPQSPPKERKQKLPSIEPRPFEQDLQEVHLPKPRQASLGEQEPKRHRRKESSDYPLPEQPLSLNHSPSIQRLLVEQSINNGKIQQHPKNLRRDAPGILSDQKEYKRLVNIYNHPDKLVSLKKAPRKSSLGHQPQSYSRLQNYNNQAIGESLPEIYNSGNKLKNYHAMPHEQSIPQILSRKKSYERMMRIDEVPGRMQQDYVPSNRPRHLSNVSSHLLGPAKRNLSSLEI